jgi:hypothetical protein
MPRKPAHNPRRYTHHCPSQGDREVQNTEEICPECGQHGKHSGWFHGLPDRWARRSRLTGVPALGPHLRYLPDILTTCKQCLGEGIIAGDEFDYECPSCAGLGGIIFRSQEEMQKIQHWAHARHNRYLREKKAKEMDFSIPPEILPEAHEGNFLQNPPDIGHLQTRDENGFTQGMLSIITYWKTFGARNRQIGELMLASNDHGWDIFMEILELWENAGYGISASQTQIALSTYQSEDALCLAALRPSLMSIAINWGEIVQRCDLSAIVLFRSALSRLGLPHEEKYVLVDDNFQQEDAQGFLVALSELARNS